MRQLFFGAALIALRVAQGVALRGVIAWTATVTAAPAMQRETVGLAFVTAITVTVLAIRALALRRVLLLRLLRSLAACDERRQTVDAFIVVLLDILLRPRLVVLLLRLVVLLLWLLRLEVLLLRLLLWIERLLLGRRRVGFAAYIRLIVTLVIERVVTAVRSAGLSRLLLIVGRLVLPLVLLRGSDKTEIMFSVLVVAL
ncbi:MAG: hypothetical protein ABSE50_16230 [Xanthobacteraceae bacterium]